MQHPWLHNQESPQIPLRVPISTEITKYFPRLYDTQQESCPEEWVRPDTVKHRTRGSSEKTPPRQGIKKFKETNILDFFKVQHRRAEESKPRMGSKDIDSLARSLLIIINPFVIIFRLPQIWNWSAHKSRHTNRN